MNNNFDKLLNDKQHGATYILNNIINYIYNNSLLPQDYIKLSELIINSYPAMAQMYHLSYKLKLLGEGKLKNIEEINGYFLKSRKHSKENCLKLLYQLKPIKITTISHSSLVINLLTEYSKHNHISITIGEGYPANEGIIAAKILKRKNIEVRIVKDEHLKLSAEKTDLILTGADATGNEWFINKQGTMELLLAGALSGIKTVVCSSSDKIIIPKILNYNYDTDFLIKNRKKIKEHFFEIIPKSIVTQFIS